MSEDKRKKAEQMRWAEFAKTGLSPEEAAQLLVFRDLRYKGRIKFYSEIVDGEFDSREEAIAATVAELKEMKNEYFRVSCMR